MRFPSVSLNYLLERALSELRGLRYLEHGALRARKTRKSRKVC
jgi:hypothetical protein